MKPAANAFKGVSAFIVTPTTDDGEEIDEGRLRELVDYEIESGVASITVFGSTGAVGSFSEDERRRVIKAAVQQASGRVPIIAGTGSITTQEAVRITRYAEEAGAAGALVVPITYWPLTPDEVVAHFERICASVSMPVGIYNNPGTTGVDITPEQIARIAQIDNICFVKESSGDPSRLISIRQRTQGAIAVLNGWDASAVQALAAGVDGWFAGSCSIMPVQCVKLFAEGKSGDFASALKTFEAMYPITELMTKKGYIRVAYAALELQGRSMGVPRRPIRPLAAEDRATLATLLRALEA